MLDTAQILLVSRVTTLEISNFVFINILAISHNSYTQGKSKQPQKEEKRATHSTRLCSGPKMCTCLETTQRGSEISNMLDPNLTLHINLTTPSLSKQ